MSRPGAPLRRALVAVGRELFGLFVDDGPFTAAIVAWLATAGLALPSFGLPPGWGGVVLFVGLAVALIWS